MLKAERMERKKEKRRNEILNAAGKLFFSRGYDDVSIDSIAQEVDLGRSTVYLYFENKEEIFFAIVLRGSIIFNLLVKNGVDKGKTGPEKLMGFKEAYQKFADDYPNYLQAINYFLSGRFHLYDRKTAENVEGFKGSGDDFKKDEIYYDDFKKDLENGKIVSDLPVPWFSSVDCINEILDLRGEMLNILRDSIKLAMAEGTIRSDLDPTEFIALLMIIMNGMDNISPDIRNMLEINGITTEKFLEDIWDFVARMI
ncbi:TetR/AcrR family transcriptional regulator [Methanobacterium aggregans]|uniref:TetR/AcrR family transcriptional regulator n=1 Tax=Methanobacterium aggregans TaxID=1615586 RepID=UPI00320F3EA5